MESLLFSLEDFSRWAFGLCDYSQVVLICDKNTRKHCQPLLSQYNVRVDHVIEIPLGEDNKTINTCLQLWAEMAEKGIDRNALILNLGGGMVTDLGAFVAATYKRGVSFVNIPTTLLGMVDAAIGNKTGVNLGLAKNQIGTFSPAEKIVLDSKFLESLPELERLSGLGEVIKYGFIHSPLLLDKMNDSDIDWNELIESCAQIKLEIVSQDPFEKGIRQSLNFGHTLGHAIESYSHAIHLPIKHGIAVGLGMLLECHLSQQLTGFSQLQRAKEYLSAHFEIPSWLREEGADKKIIPFLKYDKKNTKGKIRASLLHEIGRPALGIELNEALIENSFKWIKTL